MNTRRTLPLLDLLQDKIAGMSATHHAWRNWNIKIDYTNTHGFCKSSALEEIRRHGHTLTPCHSFGAAALEYAGEPFRDKMTRLTAEWSGRQNRTQKWAAAIEANLERLGFA